MEYSYFQHHLDGPAQFVSGNQMNCELHEQMTQNIINM